MPDSNPLDGPAITRLPLEGGDQFPETRIGQAALGWPRSRLRAKIITAICLSAGAGLFTLSAYIVKPAEVVTSFLFPAVVGCFSPMLTFAFIEEHRLRQSPRYDVAEILAKLFMVIASISPIVHVVNRSNAIVVAGSAAMGATLVMAGLILLLRLLQSPNVVRTQDS